MKQLDDKIFSIISHDLKSPFNSLIGFSKLLKDNYEKYDDDKKKQIIDILYKTANNAYTLVDNLLLWWRSQRDLLRFSPEKIVFYDFVNQAVEGLQKAATDKKISLQNLVPDDIILDADKEMIQAILVNLVSNAVKYTSPQGEVKIKAIQKPDFVEIEIQDSGVGIPEEIKDKLFTFDKDVVRIGTANEKGSGLGLVICKTLVAKHQGAITVKENQIGTSFIFTLPLKVSKKETKQQVNATKGDKLTILIAEDDEANYFLLDTLLNEYDLELEVVHVANGKDAVTVAGTIPDISLILMDMKMPVMDGYEATKIIKEKNPNLPIIAQTAYTSREDKEKAFASGCDAVIAKPIDAELLYSTIMEVLQK